ncbi:hypothetical protein MIMGU_mgv11b0209092mg, partial [Erythranthe guttata]
MDASFGPDDAASKPTADEEMRRIG